MRMRILIASAIAVWTAIFLLSARSQAQGDLGEEAPVVREEAQAPGGNPLTAPRWSPYAVGIGIGVLSWLAFLLSDHPLGVSTAFAKTAGMIEKGVRGAKVEKKLYYQEYPPKIDWEWMLVIGLFIGAFTAAWLAGTVNWIWVPPMWEAEFGGAILPRLAVALLGGICLGFGARWGCGCTSGHGISGSLQLVLSSWLSAACFFVGGIAAAVVLYRLL